MKKIIICGIIASLHSDPMHKILKLVQKLVSEQGESIPKMFWKVLITVMPFPFSL